MAVIKEELILYDKFTKTFTSYIRMAQQAASASTMAASGAQTAARATEQFTQSQKSAQNAASGLARTLKSLAGTYFGMQGIKTLVNMSDQVSQIDARLKLMTGSEEKAAAAQKQIYAAAMRSRGAYTEMADLVAKLGTLAPGAFSNTGQTVAFAEQLQKQMALSGTSAQAGSAAIYQLTQALSSGVLRGEELNSVMEQTPMIAKTIADYMGVTTGELRELASQGAVTADVVRNAILGAAKETDAAFKQLPMTWSQVWTQAKNIAIQALGPVLDGINWLANNMETLSPILFGLAAGATALAVGLGVQAAATWVANGAAKAFFTTLLTNPLTYIVLLIGLVVAAIYKWVQSVGGLEIAWLTVVDNVLYGWDTLKAGFMTGVYAVMGYWEDMAIKTLTVKTKLLNIIGDLKVGALTILQNMINGAIGIINEFINLLNKIPGVAIDPIKEVTFAATAAAENEAAKQARNTELAKMQQAAQILKTQRQNELDSMWRARDMAHLARETEIWHKQADAALQNAGTTDPASEYLSQIAGDTKSIKNSVSATEEDLQMMVDMAERRFVANVNLNAPAPVIQIQGQNTGNTREDTRYMMNEFARFLQEDLNAGTYLNYSTI